MDKNTLVAAGHALVNVLDNNDFKPRFAMWVHASDTDTWKLWLVPPKQQVDERDFYRRVSKGILENQQKLSGIDASDIEMVLDDHPAVKGLGNFMNMEGLGSVHFSGNRFNGFYLPDGIILRVDI